ncbi:MAG: S-layer homology domain-containing protein, partial [Clostridiales bacterium]|nr:S-layer homology domain-containing protein [Clostridiales bacterium]
MKNRYRALIVLAVFVLSWLPFYGGLHVAASPQAMRVGVTHASTDDVGSILANIGSGIAFDVLSSAQMGSFAAISQYDAIFINCGSHHDANAQVLRQFVQAGGVVYASDLAASVINQAFPGMFTQADGSAQTVSGAQIVHTSLASHMGRSSINVVFDLGGWAVINNLSPAATVYITGNVSGHGNRPLAFSFDYGQGRVFFTSFHNHQQATGDMVNFIEYLIFRIRHMEAERNLQAMAYDAGYVFDGSVFGVLNPGQTSQPFHYTPQANDFMLLFDTTLGNFTILLSDPMGNVFSTEDVGILTDIGLDAADLHLAFQGFPVELITTEQVVEGLGPEGFRVLNPLDGQWSFWVRSYNPAPDSMFAVGLAERPTAALTRVMFVQVLANLEGLDLSPYSHVPPTFDDVPPGSWFFEAVEWAASEGLVEGFGDRVFQPNSPLEREQMAAMLHRFAHYRDVTLPRLHSDLFLDQQDISDWAEDAVNALHWARVMPGRPNGAFEPQVTATTTEIADIFMNFLPLVGVSYDYDPLAFIYTFEPAHGSLADVVDAVSAQSAIVNTIIGLTPQQRASGDAMNSATLHIENIARRGTTMPLPEDGSLNLAALNFNAHAAGQVHQNAMAALANENVTLMRNLRTNLNFVSDDADVLSVAFPDDVTGVAFDNVTIEADFAAVTVNRENIPRGSAFNIRMTHAALPPDMPGIDIAYGINGARGANPDNPDYYGQGTNAAGGPGFNPLDFWSVPVVAAVLAAWFAVWRLGKKFRLWVVPTFLGLALGGNAFTHFVLGDGEFPGLPGFDAMPPGHAEAIAVEMTEGMRVTLSLPMNGERTHANPENLILFNEQGEMQFTKYNPVTGTIDARVDESGTFILREYEVSFADIQDRSRMMQDAITRLAARGIMRGAVDGNFYPDNPITRSEFVAAIIMAFDMVDINAQSAFTDIDPADWYYLAVATAYNERLVAGFEDHTFRGGLDIPKDQLTVIAANTLAQRMGYVFPGDVEAILAIYLDRDQ